MFCPSDPGDQKFATNFQLHLKWDPRPNIQHNKFSASPHPKVDLPPRADLHPFHWWDTFVWYLEKLTNWWDTFIWYLKKLINCETRLSVQLVRHFCLISWKVYQLWSLLAAEIVYRSIITNFIHAESQYYHFIFQCLWWLHGCLSLSPLSQCLAG